MMRLREIFESGDDLISRAKHLAAQLHAKQKYGTHPYIVHLSAVAKKVEQAGGTPEQIAAAWLHDSLEDTLVTQDELRSQFGEEVANMVWAVTGEGKNRREKLDSVIGKIANTPGADIVKSADRLCNTQACIDDKLFDKARMYKGEHEKLSPVLGKNPMSKELYRIFAQMD